MDSNTLEMNCQLVSRAIAGMIRHSIREEAFREKCFTLLQVTNSNDAEMKLQRKLKQCTLRHQYPEAVSPSLQDSNNNDNQLTKISNPDPMTDTKASVSHKSANKENVPVINSYFSGTKSVIQKTTVPRKGNFVAEHHITKDLSELESSLEWDSTLTQRCSPQELLQQVTNALESDTYYTYEQSNWFQPNSQELEW